MRPKAGVVVVALEEARMTASVNRQVILAARPQGMPKASDFKVESVREF
jgi:hypothetical protein